MAVIQIFWAQIILSTRCLAYSGLASLIPLNMNPDIKNASKLPKGIEMPQIAVTSVLSLSGNQPLQNQVIILKKRGHAILSQNQPAIIGQNLPFHALSNRSHAPENMIKQETLVTLWAFILLYMYIEAKVVGIQVAVKLIPLIATNCSGTSQAVAIVELAELKQRASRLIKATQLMKKKSRGQRKKDFQTSTGGGSYSIVF